MGLEGKGLKRMFSDGWVLGESGRVWEEDLVSTVVRHRYNQLNRTITLIIDAGVWAQYGVRLEERRRLAAG